MVIAFVITAMVILSGITIGTYSIFMPFLQNMREIQDYHTAYYAAIWSLERAMLATKVQWFWFDGQTLTWRSEPSIIGTWSSNNMRREIQWTTTRIPSTQSNIPNLFITTNNTGYNAIYHQQKISIQTDTRENTNSNPYIIQPLRTFTGNYISSHWQVPDKIGWLLCTICDQNQDSIWDDIIILRRRSWFNNEQSFILIPITDTDKEAGSVWENDMHIRASIINNNSIPNNIPIVSFENSFNPLTNKPFTIIEKHTWLGDWFEAVEEQTFSQIAQNAAIQGNIVSYYMIEKPESADWFLYPFIEYYIQADGKISDIQWDITGHAKTNHYHIKIQIYRDKNQWQPWTFTLFP